MKTNPEKILAVAYSVKDDFCEVLTLAEVIRCDTALFLKPQPRRSDWLLLGVYSSREKALEAKKRFDTSKPSSKEK